MIPVSWSVASCPTLSWESQVSTFSHIKTLSSSLHSCTLCHSGTHLMEDLEHSLSHEYMRHQLAWVKCSVITAGQGPAVQRPDVFTLWSATSAGIGIGIDRDTSQSIRLARHRLEHPDAWTLEHLNTGSLCRVRVQGGSHRKHSYQSRQEQTILLPNIHPGFSF